MRDLVCKMMILPSALSQMDADRPHSYRLTRLLTAVRLVLTRRRDRDTQVRSLQAQLAAAAARAVAPLSAAPAGPNAALPDPRLGELTERIEELEKQLAASCEEVAGCRRLVAQLQAEHPDVGAVIESALQAERAAQEDRNRRVRAGRLRAAMGACRLGLVSSVVQTSHGAKQRCAIIDALMAIAVKAWKWMSVSQQHS